MSKKKTKQKRIWVTDEVTRELKTEFNQTGTSILQALKFASYSKTAKLIREAAMKKMKDVLSQNEVLMSEFH